MDLSATIYSELHSLAARQLDDQSRAHTLQPTALVHEAFLRIQRLDSAGKDGRRQFYALAGKVMRSVLVDHARRRQAKKRDGGQRVDLADDLVGDLAGDSARTLDVLALHEALDKLGELDAELVTIVESMFFGGLTEAETAEVLGVSDRTVRRGWRTARAFLQQALSGT